MRADQLVQWRRVALQAGLTDQSQIPAVAWRSWHAEHGDRRQELNFIGIDLDPDAIRKRMDACAD